MINGVSIMIAPFLGLSCIEGGKSLSCAKSGSKYAHVGSVMTILATVRMPYLVSTMLTCQQDELNVVEKNTCNHFCPMSKLKFHAMLPKVS
jgi:hypothetical protein